MATLIAGSPTQFSKKVFPRLFVICLAMLAERQEHRSGAIETVLFGQSGDSRKLAQQSDQYVATFFANEPHNPLLVLVLNPM
ncbi:MAG: hypothetical protein R3D52_05705 [Xanthobacteraceae bacterium]